MPCITKNVIGFGLPLVIGCDAMCGKAWGRNSRPRIQLSDDVDDVVWLADDELGTAPADPGTYEGGEAKPTTADQRLNKWCARECERCAMAERGKPLEFPNWFQRRFNRHNRNEEPSSHA